MIMGIMGSIPRMQFRDQIGNRLSQRWVRSRVCVCVCSKQAWARAVGSPKARSVAIAHLSIRWPRVYVCLPFLCHFPDPRSRAAVEDHSYIFSDRPLNRARHTSPRPALVPPRTDLIRRLL